MAKGAAKPIDAALGAAVLHELLTRHEPVTLAELSRTLRLPMTRVRREVDRLVEAGCEIAEHPQSGVALVKSALGVWEDYLRWRLKAPGDKRVIQIYRQTASTQDVARRIATRGGVGADGAIAVADHQRAGRGRLGRKWYAPPGSCVLFSTLRVEVFARIVWSLRRRLDWRGAGSRGRSHAAARADQMAQ